MVCSTRDREDTVTTDISIHQSFITITLICLNQDKKNLHSDPNLPLTLITNGLSIDRYVEYMKCHVVIPPLKKAVLEMLLKVY